MEIKNIFIIVFMAFTLVSCNLNETGTTTDSEVGSAEQEEINDPGNNDDEFESEAPESPVAADEPEEVSSEEPNEPEPPVAVDESVEAPTEEPNEPVIVDNPVVVETPEVVVGEPETTKPPVETVEPNEPVETPQPDEDEPELSNGRITYVGKISNITDFRGLGQHLYYFPAFDLDTPDDFHRTDENAVYYNKNFNKFRHHRLLDFNRRTFSPDALGSPLGVKARGGYMDWPIFTLPNGQVGLSGTIYDDATRQNTNNTVNQIKLNRSSPSRFCLNIILDNTFLQNIPDNKLVVRTDQSREDLSLEGHPDLTFDGVPDMYTFRYEDMKNDGKIKIRLATNKPDGRDGEPVTGAGFAGIMISDYSTCAPSAYVSVNP